MPLTTIEGRRSGSDRTRSSTESRSSEFDSVAPEVKTISPPPSRSRILRRASSSAAEAARPAGCGEEGLAWLAAADAAAAASAAGSGGAEAAQSR